MAENKKSSHRQGELTETKEGKNPKNQRNRNMERFFFLPDVLLADWLERSPPFYIDRVIRERR